MPNGLDQDQDRRSIGPDLSPICLQRFSADDNNKVKKKLFGIRLPFHHFHILKMLTLIKFCVVYQYKMAIFKVQCTYWGNKMNGQLMCDYEL